MIMRFETYILTLLHPYLEIFLNKLRTLKQNGDFCSAVSPSAVKCCGPKWVVMTPGDKRIPWFNYGAKNAFRDKEKAYKTWVGSQFRLLCRQYAEA